MKEKKVSAIKHGTVIDHIPSIYTFKIVELLQLQNVDKTLIIASGLQSKRLPSKGIVKVADLELDNIFLQKIALIAPKVTVSIIRDYVIVQKTELQIPKEVNNILVCINPNCITNHEEACTHFFIEREEPLLLRCRYCERSVTQEDMEIC